MGSEMCIRDRDSGMRLSEALGLAKEDIKLDEPIPHIRLIPHLGDV